MVKMQVHSKLSGSYINSGTFKAPSDVYLWIVLFLYILFNYTIYACMLAEQLNISEMLCIHL